MKKQIKQYQSLNNFVPTNFYSLTNSINLLKKLASAKFNETVEVHLVLNTDRKNPKHILHTPLKLPFSNGKLLKTGVYIQPDRKLELLNLGAHRVGSDEFLQELKAGLFDFDVLITTPELMPDLMKLGRILGPKGLMPSLKLGTITNNLEATLSEFKNGRCEYRSDSTGNIHISLGKINARSNQLVENFNALLQSVEQNKPSGLKGLLIKKIYVCTTMGPSIKLNLMTLN
jgi:large subunit ribosomal protein L1